MKNECQELNSGSGEDLYTGLMCEGVRIYMQIRQIEFAAYPDFGRSGVDFGIVKKKKNGYS